jgi:uncharacterized protein
VRVILDTNVLVLGVFFGGVPGRILEAWRDARIQLVLSPEILEEYQRVGQELRTKHPDVDLEPFLGLLAIHAEIVQSSPLPESVCSDPDDDKFLACAAAAGVVVIVSGDRDLLDRVGVAGCSSRPTSPVRGGVPSGAATIALNREEARYILIGGFAVILHGLVRTTKYIDLLVDSSEENVKRVKRAFADLPDNAAALVEDSDVRSTDWCASRTIVVDLLAAACGLKPRLFLLKETVGERGERRSLLRLSIEGEQRR